MIIWALGSAWANFGLVMAHWNLKMAIEGISDFNRLNKTSLIQMKSQPLKNIRQELSELIENADIIILLYFVNI